MPKMFDKLFGNSNPSTDGVHTYNIENMQRMSADARKRDAERNAATEAAAREAQPELEKKKEIVDKMGGPKPDGSFAKDHERTKILLNKRNNTMRSQNLEQGCSWTSLVEALNPSASKSR